MHVQGSPPVQGKTLDLPAWLSRRLITVADYYKMAEAGILSPDDRIELIEGQIIEMSPIGSDHSGQVNRLTRLLINAVGDRAVLGVQNPVRLSDITEPEPDFAVLKPRQDDYAGSMPGPQDVLLLIEVSDSSLGYDRGVKARLYARHAIPEFWIVNVRNGTVVVHRAPAEGSYTSIVQITRHDTLTIAALPGIELPAAGIFPG